MAKQVFDYVIINRGIPKLEQKMLVGVWEDGVYRPLNRDPKKVFDYVTINKGVPNFEHKLLIGVWEDGVYSPLNREELEFYATQYTFDPSVTGAKLVDRPS